jgi:hypothetical protein
MDTVKETVDEEMESSNLLDCYRIALDFGMPAALKAYEKLKRDPGINDNGLNTTLEE